MIVVIDYKAGNGPSVKNALDHLGIDACLTADRELVLSADGIILPGVGSADATMESLRELALLPVLDEAVLERKIPFLGICVGMQVLLSHSAEGDCDCLGWIPGQVVRFEEGVRIPQMGYNTVRFQGSHPLVEGLEEGYFYFVNSYYARPELDADIAGVTEYGHPFCSLIARDNIMGSQFHMEKSGPAGLKLLERFAALCEARKGGAAC
ncbi:MAG: imidazole glycerol phosphate synthase subunit HisH [Clostridiales bacterium]|nr:imidazole glycerol phosphate synthase subunit HisH [Clostridiales bacterium]